MKRTISLLLCIVLLGSLCTVASGAAESGDDFVVELTDYAINGYYAFAQDNAADVYEDANGQFFRMSYKGARYSCFYFSTEGLIDGNGTYKLEFDVRASEDLVTPNCFVALMREDLSQPCAWTVASSKQAIDRMEGAENGFRKVTLEFRIDDYYTHFYKFLKIGYDCTENPSGYLDVDNIRLYKGTELVYDETVNADDSLGGDFENFAALMPSDGDYRFTTSGWTADKTYYNLMGYTENAVVCEDGNHFLKLYASEKADTTITKNLSVGGLKEAGWYKLKIDLKGGADFYSDNIGFRLQTADQKGYHAAEVNISPSSVKTDKWTTIEAEFYVAETSASAWINFDFWVFLHNNEAEHKSEENYLQVDNIRFYKAQNTIEFGENLLPNGALEDFKASQGRREVPPLTTQDYAYSRVLIAQDFLEKFTPGTKLTQSWESQNYFGTIDLDVPPVFGEVDGYYAMQFVHDGKSVVKTYASATYLLHLFDFTVNNCYKLSFDYKTEVADTDILRFAFVSNDNEDDFMLDLYEATVGENKTKGSNKDIYTYVVTDNGDGWRHVELIFRPNIGFKTRVNSMRFLLMTNYNEGNRLYVANFALTEYSDSPLSPLTAQPAADVVPQQQRDYTKIVLCVAVVAVVCAAGIAAICIGKRKKHD